MINDIVLRELKEVVSRNSVDYADNLRKTAAYLLQKQWAWKGKRGQKEHFQVCEDNAPYFHKLFDALDMDWYYDRNFGYVGVLPRGTGSQLDITSTVFLLILRKMYDTEASMGRTELGRVTPPTVELLSQYEQVKGERPLLTVTSEALDTLRKKGIIELGPRDPDTKLPEVTVLPNITRVVGPAFLGSLESFMASYATNSESGDEPHLTTDPAEASDDNAE
ncbi:MAG: hypothetical protein CL583_16020 [Alteromonadaceae bacterium]|nr:hypothetical protein [Alteromonadaceae bacterium]|tara:strand:- start:2636 stop:3298 length:663 start_codon:yes stop_codon:yes gene_type:complete